MAQKSVSECDAKKILAKILDDYNGELAVIDAASFCSESDIKTKNFQTVTKDEIKKKLLCLAASDSTIYGWLKEAKNGGKLVAKPDQLFGKRGKNNLFCLGKNLDETAQWTAAKINQQVTLDSGITGILKKFIIEPMVPHDQEYYAAIKSNEHGDTIYLSASGGMDIEENWDTVKSIHVAPLETPDEDEIESILLDICSWSEIASIKKFVLQLWDAYQQAGFAYLEINPFTVTDKGVIPLDCVAKVDDTAEFECRSLWCDAVDELEFPPPFGQELSKEELYIKHLDSLSGASLKLKLLNPDGRIWNMVAGGGASVIYADTVADMGAGRELAVYGEYSGDPSRQLTYEYAKTLMDLMTKNPDPQKRPKLLLIGGGIANFTDVAKTFTGIIMAMEEFADRLKKVNTYIYVRRGGPNYKAGLKNIKDAGEKLGLPIAVFGPETHMTDIVRMALEQG